MDRVPQDRLSWDTLFSGASNVWKMGYGAFVRDLEEGCENSNQWTVSSNSKWIAELQALEDKAKHHC